MGRGWVFHWKQLDYIITKVFSCKKKVLTRLVKTDTITIDDVFRLRELHTLKGHVESVVKLKGLDIDTIQQHYTV